MKYTSTRSKIAPISSAEAILQGLAEDGGLFVPEKIPKVTLEEIEGLRDKNYEERAAWLLGKYLTDYTEYELGECAELAYNWFDIPARVPVAILIQDQNNPVKDQKIEQGENGANKEVYAKILMAYIQVATDILSAKAKVINTAFMDKFRIITYYCKRIK